MSPRARQRLVTRALTALGRLAVCALAVTLLVSSVRSGARYFYCPAMHAVMETSCCAQHSDDGAEPIAELRSRDCCEARRIGTLPSGALSAAAVDLDAPLASVTTPPSAAALRGEAILVTAPQAHRERAPPPPTARQRRATLMVLHI